MNPPCNPSLFDRAAKDAGGQELFIQKLGMARQTYFDMKKRGWVNERWLKRFVEESKFPAADWRPDLASLFRQ